MKKVFILLLILGVNTTVYSQFVATIEMKEEVEGVCNQNEVFVLFGMLPDQEDAKCPIGKEALLLKLNNETEYLKNYPKYKSKGSVDVLVNCKSEVVQVKVDFKNLDKKLESQLEDIFRNLGAWEAGKLNGKEVDSKTLFSFKIKKGKIFYD